MYNVSWLDYLGKVHSIECESLHTSLALAAALRVSPEAKHVMHKPSYLVNNLNMYKTYLAARKVEINA